MFNKQKEGRGYGDIKKEFFKSTWSEFIIKFSIAAKTSI